MGREIRRVPKGWKHPKTLTSGYTPLHDKPYSEAAADNEDYYRPEWKPEEMTHYQLYETVSEGTPISPVFSSLDQLEDWMVTNGDPVHGAISRRAAREFCKSGYAPSMMFIPGRGLLGGIESLDDGTKPIRRRIQLTEEDQQKGG